MIPLVHSKAWRVRNHPAVALPVRDATPFPNLSTVFIVPLWPKAVMNHRATMDTEMARGIIPRLNPTLELA